MSDGSFTRTFPIVVDCKGGAGKLARCYAQSLIPAKTGTSTYALLFNRSVTVELVSASGRLVVTPQKADVKPAIATCAFTALDNPATSVSQLGIINGVAYSGSAIDVALTASTGLRRVLRGAVDAGDDPAILIMIENSASLNEVHVASFVGEFTVKFVGQSAASQVELPFEVPAVATA